MSRQLGNVSLIAKVAILVAIVVSGVVHGRIGGRWKSDNVHTDFSAQLDAIPDTVGDWAQVAEIPPEENVLNILQCDGYLHRQYVNKRTGSRVSMAIVVGPSGPTAVHTPEICYSSQDFTIVGKRAVAELGEHTYWFTNLRRKNVHGAPFRLYYAWSKGALWTASNNPRIEFGGLPHLFKIQLSADIRAIDEDRDPIVDFLEVFQSECWPIS